MKSLQLSSPHIIAMVGVPGAGKTQFAEQFAQMFSAPRISCDMLLPAISDEPVRQSICTQLLAEVMKTRQTIIYEGATDRRSWRSELAKVARESGYRVLFVWVQTDTATAKSRWLKQTKEQPAAFDHRVKQFSPPHDSEPVVVISGRHTYSTQAKTVLRKLTEPRRVVTEFSSHDNDRPTSCIVVG